MQELVVPISDAKVPDGHLSHFPFDKYDPISHPHMLADLRQYGPFLAGSQAVAPQEHDTLLRELKFVDWHSGSQRGSGDELHELLGA